MSCTLLSRTTDLKLDSYTAHTDTLYETPVEVENIYVTQPMAAMQPTYQPLDEEALYTSFEQAISERVSTLQGRLSRPSSSKLAARHQRYYPVPQAATAPKTNLHLLCSRGVQRVVTFVGLALISLLIGFDLMGLLVLSLR